MNKIIPTKEQRKELREVFGLSDSSLSLILNFKRNGHRSAAVRLYAANRLNSVIILD